jgi:hypothetical protein
LEVELSGKKLDHWLGFRVPESVIEFFAWKQSFRRIKALQSLSADRLPSLPFSVFALYAILTTRRMASNTVKSANVPIV